MLCNVALLNSRVPIRKIDTIVGVVTVFMHVSNGILSEYNTTPRRDVYFVAASALKRSVVVSPGAAMKKPEENPTLSLCFDFHLEPSRPLAIAVLSHAPAVGGGELHRTGVLRY